MRSGTIALLLGILCVQQMPGLPDPWLVQFLPLALFAAVFAPGLRLPALFLAGLLWATFRAHLAVTEILPTSLEGVDAMVEGRVAGVPQVTPRRTRFEFEVETLSPLQAARELNDSRGHRRFEGRARVAWYGAEALRAGERWRLKVRLYPPRGYSNPGGFDYERWLFARGIRATGYVRKSGEAVRLEPASPWDLHGWRQHTAARIFQALPGREAAGIVAALAVGVRGSIDRHQWQVFRETGTAHLMAISGLHIGLMAGLVFLLTRWVFSLGYRACLWMPAQRIAAAAGLAAGIAYAAMAGFSLPTQRAVLMLAVMMWCLNRSRATGFSVALCAALAAVVVLDPFSVLGVSLWLSFAAVAVLAFGTLHRPGKWQRGFRGFWHRWGRAQTLAALGLAPILMAVFGQQPLLSPVANVLAIPWMAFLVVPGAIAGAGLALVSPAAGGVVLSASASLIEWLWPTLELMAAAGFTLEPPAAVPILGLAAAALGVVLLILPREMPGRWLGILFMLPLIGLTVPVPQTGTLRLTVLDVGHGLAVVVRTARGNLVFDTGPRYSGGFDAGADVVAPFLRHHGVRFIDRLIISHPDNDHAGGAEGLLAKLPVGEVIGPDGSCIAGTNWRWDGYDFRILHPRRGHAFQGNDASCVLRISGPGGSILIAADIEAAAEAELSRNPGSRLASDVLVAPHHGSATSSTPQFVRAVRPALVLLSTSGRRRPRLPDAEVVARYQKSGARIESTAQAGAITVVLANDRPIKVWRHREQSARYWQRSFVSDRGFASRRGAEESKFSTGRAHARFVIHTEHGRSSKR